MLNLKEFSLYLFGRGAKTVCVWEKEEQEKFPYAVS